MTKKNLIVIGNGMVGHKFLECMIAKGATSDWNLITFCAEPRVAYDRVNLSGFFAGKTAGDLSLVEPGLYQTHNIQIYIGDKVDRIDRVSKTITSANGVTIRHEGSYQQVYCPNALVQNYPLSVGGFSCYSSLA